MMLSLNEVEVTVRKAALGAGFPFGLAEDAGAAASWLAAAGFPVEKLLAAALEKRWKEALQVWKRGSVYRLCGGEGVCSAIAALPSACDLVVAGAGFGERIRVESVVDVPGLAIAEAALASAGSGAPLAVEIGMRLSALTYEDPPILFDTVAELAGLRDAPVRIRLAETEERLARDAHPTLNRARELALGHGVSVEEPYWERIQALAAWTLVPATMQSRERGAGAGLIDTD